MPFDDVTTNIGGGYISNSSSSDYGKFIVPVNRTYQFIVTLSAASLNYIGSSLYINSVYEGYVRSASSRYSEATMSRVVSLEEGTKVWVKIIIFGLFTPKAPDSLGI